MTFPNCFDAVIMLTWSDWKTQARSNCYHYAKCFASTVPVLFLQHQHLKRSQLTIEPTEVPNVDIVNISIGLNDREIIEIKQLMRARGIRRPLVWIYDSMNYQPLLDAMPNTFRVYHATEDYLTKSDNWSRGWWSSSNERVAKSVVRVLEQVDFMVACTEGVANSYLTLGKYQGRHAVIENGCDTEYFIEYVQRINQANKVEKTPIAIFQGDINSRLDYPLMHALIRRMPTWEFRFCGNAVESNEWRGILKLPNVKYYGALNPEKLAQLMCESTVGIITYIQDQRILNSLPLKAYEYVACGLPVVTVPIAGVECDPLMIIATTSEEFENALLTAAKTRFDPILLKLRRNAALAKSYKRRFDSMCKFLQEAAAPKDAQQKKLKLVMLYESFGSMHGSTIQQHLKAFEKYSNHSVTYVPATSSFWNLPPEKIQHIFDFSYFDVVVVHYSVRLSVKDNLDEGLARALESYNGLKVLFIQDECEGAEIARQWMDRLQFDLVYTCVPDSGLERIYPFYRFPSTEFFSVYIDVITNKGQEDVDYLAMNDYCIDKSGLLNNFSSRAFIERIDADFERRVMVRKSASLLMGLFSVSIDGSLRQVLPLLPFGVVIEPYPLGHSRSAHETIGSLPTTQPAKTGNRFSKIVLVEGKNATEFFHFIRRISNLMFISISEKITYAERRALRWANAARVSNPILHRLMWFFWKLLPTSLRIRFLQALRKDQK